MHSALLAAAAIGALETDFNDGWTFRRGDGDFHLPVLTSDGGAWRAVETPHDWAIEDLPSREADDVTPVLAVRHGSWRFAQGEGNETWAAPGYNDAAWQSVAVPADWRTYGYEETNAFGWFRSNFTVSAAALAAANAGTLQLALGDVATGDRTYVNGKLVGSTGSMGKPGSCSSSLAYRRYACAASVLHLGDDNVVAVQVWSEGGPLAPPSNRTFAFAPGAIAAGNDVLPPANTTVGAAIATCNATKLCIGVTFEAESSAKPLAMDTPVKAYFKSVDDVNADSKWQSYVAPVGRPGVCVPSSLVSTRSHGGLVGSSRRC